MDATTTRATVQVEYKGVTLYCDVMSERDELTVEAVRCEDDIMPLLDAWNSNKDLERFYDEVHYEYKWGRE